MTFKELLNSIEFENVALHIVKMDGIVVRLVTGTAHEILTEDEKRLRNLLAEGRKYSDLILDYDPTLGNQVVISYAAYNSNNPLIK